MLRDPVKTIGNILDKQKLSYIGSVDAEGFPNVKAMLRPRKRVGLHTIYFSTNTSSMRVAQFRENPKASVYVCDGRFYRSAMLVGSMEVLEDQNSKDMLWEKGDTQYYKLGPTDPDYCVLKFTASKGRYYSNYASEDFEVN